MNLQIKVTGVILLIVGLSVGSAEFIDRQYIETFARENFQGEMVAVVQHIDTSISTLSDFHDRAKRARELDKLRRSRPDLLKVELYSSLAPHAESPVILISSGNTDTSSRGAVPPLVERALAKAKPVSDLQTSKGNNSLKIAAPILVNGEIVGASYAEFSSAGFDNLLEYQRRLSLARRLLTWAMVVLAINLFLYLKVHRPVGTLLSAVEAVGQGNMAAVVPVRGQDEIGQLAERFNLMVNRIRVATEENRRLYEELQGAHDDLQRRVEEATAEIRQKNRELARTNELLSTAQREVARAQRLSAIGQVAAVVAHRIGTPLTALSGHIQLLVEDPQLGTVARGRLETVENQIERTSKIIQDLLIYARKPDLVLSSLNVNSCLEECVSLLSPELGHRNVALTLNVSSGLGAVQADQHQLQEVFCNLIENALDAMPGGGTLAIRTYAIERSGQGEKDDQVAIEIADTGQGIAPEHLDQIFQPFFTTKKSGRGTGLGLAIARETVRAHQGQIKVETEVGNGTRFLVLLPIFQGKV